MPIKLNAEKTKFLNPNSNRYVKIGGKQHKKLTLKNHEWVPILVEENIKDTVIKDPVISIPNPEFKKQIQIIEKANLIIEKENKIIQEEKNIIREEIQKPKPRLSNTEILNDIFEIPIETPVLAKKLVIPESIGIPKEIEIPAKDYEKIKELIKKAKEYEKIAGEEIGFKIKEDITNLKEAQKQLDVIETVMGVGNTSGLVGITINSSLLLAEGVYQEYEGTSNVLFANQKYNKLLDVLNIKYGGKLPDILSAYAPEISLGAIIASTALSMKAKNIKEHPELVMKISNRNQTKYVPEARREEKGPGMFTKMSNWIFGASEETVEEVFIPEPNVMPMPTSAPIPVVTKQIILESPQKTFLDVGEYREDDRFSKNGSIDFSANN